MGVYNFVTGDYSCLYSWLSSCCAIAIRVDFKQCFEGSIYITAQCIETNTCQLKVLGKIFKLFVTFTSGCSFMA